MKRSQVVTGVALLVVAASCGRGRESPAPGLPTEPRVEVLASSLEGLSLRVHFPPGGSERLRNWLGDWTKVEVPGCQNDAAPEGHPDVPHWGALFAVVRESLPTVNLVIEREAGPDRIADIREAVDLIVTHLPMASTEPARG